MIKNVIFDFGGVILNIDYHLRVDAFTQLGAKNVDDLYDHYHELDLFDQYESGQISSAQFRQQAKALLAIEQISDDQFDEAWNAILLDVPEERLNFIAELKRLGYRTVLYSNTNEIHLKKMFEKINPDTFHDHFYKVYYSHQFNFIKPDKSGFEKILAENNFCPQETLFIDDNAGHVLSAKEVGLYTYHLTPDRDLWGILPLIVELDGHTDHEYF